MAYTPKKLVKETQMTVGVTTHYTVPTATTAIVKEIRMTNNSETNRVRVSFYTVPAGGAADPTNAEFVLMTLQPLETRIFSRSCVMSAGDTIQAWCESASTIGLSVSGVERS